MRIDRKVYEDGVYKERMKHHTTYEWLVYYLKKSKGKFPKDTEFYLHLADDNLRLDTEYYRKLKDAGL